MEELDERLAALDNEIEAVMAQDLESMTPAQLYKAQLKEDDKRFGEIKQEMEEIKKTMK